LHATQGSATADIPRPYRAELAVIHKKPGPDSQALAKDKRMKEGVRCLKYAFKRRLDFLEEIQMTAFLVVLVVTMMVIPIMGFMRRAGASERRCRFQRQYDWNDVCRFFQKITSRFIC
jgi:hypothetical protein